MASVNCNLSLTRWQTMQIDPNLPPCPFLGGEGSTHNHAESCWMLTWGASCVSTPACLSLYSQEANFQANTRKTKCLWRSMTTMPKSQKFKTQILAYWSVQILWFPLLISQGIVFFRATPASTLKLRNGRKCALFSLLVGLRKENQQHCGK